MNIDKKNTGGELYHISNDFLSNVRHKSNRLFQAQLAARLICTQEVRTKELSSMQEKW